MINLGPPKVAGADLPRGPDPSGSDDAAGFDAELSPRLEKENLKSAVQTLTTSPKKDKVVIEFMDSFEGEFKIPVTRLVKGIEAQSQNSVGLSVEDAALRAVKQLGLSKEDQEKAMSMVLAFIQNLKELMPSPNFENLNLSQLNLNQTGLMGRQEKNLSPLTLAMLQRVNDEKQHQELMHKNLDSMQSQFWPKPEAVSSNELVDLSSQPLSEPITNPLADTLEVELSKEYKDFEPKNFENQNFENQNQKFFENQNPSPKGVLTPEKLTGIMAFGLNQRKLSEELLKYNEDLFYNSNRIPQEFSAQNSMNPTEVKSSFEELSTIAPETTQVISSIQGAQGAESQKSKFNLNDGDSQGKTKEDGSEGRVSKSNDINSFFVGSAGLKSVDSISTTAKGAQPLLSRDFQVSDDQADANVKRVLSQANFLIKKGGGEVKVQLNPEGLGEIRLMVAVNDGKVGIQMQASSQEAKNMIEGGFSELKKSLSNHNLSMDAVQVDVVKSLSTDMSAQGGRSGFDSQQSSQQSSQQDPRQSTQQFWSQFHQNFGSPHQQGKSYAELRWDNLGSARKTEPLEPVTSSAAAKKRVVGSKGSGLNMVA